MSKFTEGPWNFTYFIRPNGEELWGVTANLKDEQGLYKVVCYSGNGPTSEANARLIAAAPDMYQMLKRLHELGGLGLEVHDEIVKVLAKVEGK